MSQSETTGIHQAHPMGGFFDAVYNACIWIAGISIALMGVIIPWGIFARYVLGTGSSWPEPTAVILMMVFSFLGAAACYRAGSHIAVGMLTDALPASLQKPLVWVVDILMALISLFVLVWGLKLVQGTMGQTLADLPWLPVGLTYLALPLGALATLVFVVEKMLWGSQHHRAIVRFDQDEKPASSEAV